MGEARSAESAASARLTLPFVGGSEMAARMAAFDWADSPLGPVSGWPPSLRTAVGICLSSRYPMVIWWGAELVLLYNDAWVPILGPDKHPALGLPGRQVWPEMWHIIGRQLHSVLQTGRATFSDDQLLPARRFGYLEEAYFTYSYSAVHDETGAVSGAFTAITETTPRVLSERRLRSLRALSDATALAASRIDATLQTVAAAGLAALGDNRADVPFAAVYARTRGEPAARLVSSMGLAEPAALPSPVAEPTAPWWHPAGSGMRSQALLPEWAAAVLPGANPVGDEPPATAVILSIQSGDDDIAGVVLIAGVTPYRQLDEDFSGYLSLVAAQLGRAVSDARGATAEREARQRDATLSRFAAVLARSSTPTELLAAAAAHIGGAFPGAKVRIAQWDAHTKRPAVLAFPPADDDGSEELAAALGVARNRSATSVLTVDTDQATTVLAAPLGAHAAVAMELPVRSARSEDRDLFGLLAGHLGQALVIAREFEQHRAAAITLQDAILGPTELPHGFAVRYTPAVEPFEVGGDWYDLVPLDGDCIGIVVGDCVGRGLPAAAAMGQLRSAAQALLLRTGDPAETLDSLDRFARRVPAAVGTTVFCAVIDQAASTIRYSSAGHPPPIVVGPGTVRTRLERAPGLPLAVADRQPRPEAVAGLAAGATLLLYTDGLIERRHESLTAGIERAAAVLATCAEIHPEEVADQLMTTLAPPTGYDDDVAVLLYRHRPEPLSVRVAAEPAALATVRTELRRWLPAAGVDAGTAANILLTVGEAASNATEHAPAGVRHRVVLTVSASVDHDGLQLSVSDNGCWKPPPESPGNRGHGLRVIEALLDRVHLTSTDHGTTVDMLKELR
ncbi:hypothetical protein B1R94_13345 [Mycolicibacterium litorale]|nr:hypothetical protein B1R94_13345 [Mycolicibacterium litorale]